MPNLHRGLNHLTTILTVAPMFGLLGTVDGIFAGLPGVVGETALSTHLVLTITTKWAHAYLHEQADALHAQTLSPPREVR
jgi:hypothetical protein